MRVDIDHTCGRQHHSFPAVAACTWPEAGYIIGDGAFALVAHCDIESVLLFPSRELALAHLEDLEHTGCGLRCRGDHEVVPLLSARIDARS